MSDPWEAFEEPTLVGEEGWSELPMPRTLGRGRSFVSGDNEGDRLRVKYFRRESDNAMVGRVWFGPGAEGPPYFVHGGSMAAVLDEVMGGSAWLAGHTVVAAQITVRFKKMIPLFTIMTLEAGVERVEGRRVYVRGSLTAPDGIVHTEGEGVFIKLAPEHFADLAERAGKTWVQAQETRPAVEGVAAPDSNGSVDDNGKRG